MSQYPFLLKEQAFTLRRCGFSVKEIAQELKIAQSTSSLWVRDIVLNNVAIKRLKKRRLFGYYKAASHWISKASQEENLFRVSARDIITHTSRDSNQFALYAALLFWCEGGKREKSSLRIINSDPVFIKVFLKLLRNAFDIDEHKFRVQLHIHEYHNDLKQKKYWSKITNVSIKQFRKFLIYRLYFFYERGIVINNGSTPRLIFAFSFFCVRFKIRFTKLFNRDIGNF